MDESDELLAERLRQELEAQGKATAFGGKSARAKEETADAQDEQDEMDFMKAMEKFRAAKRSGDPAATAKAEKELQGFVRAEMIRKESCTK